jgi:RimJ/RimL family protein N-acetyltransferase
VAEPISSDGSFRLTGHGLVLREWRDADLPVMPDLFDDELVARYTSLPAPFVAADYLATIRAARAERGRLYLAITQDGDAPLGLALLAPDRSEIGYAVGPAHRRQGLALRSTLLLTEHGHRLGLSPLCLRIVAGNAASVAVALAAGYRRAGSEPTTDGTATLDVYTHHRTG